MRYKSLLAAFIPVVVYFLALFGGFLTKIAPPEPMGAFAVGILPFLILIAQFLALCSRSKWSKHFTNSPFLALLAMDGSKAAYKIISACSNAVS